MEKHSPIPPQKAEPPPEKNNETLASKYSSQLWELCRYILNNGLIDNMPTIVKIKGVETYLLESKKSVIVFRDKTSTLQKVFDSGEEGINKLGRFVTGKIPFISVAKIEEKPHDYFVAVNGSKIETEVMSQEFLIMKARETISV
ncbi:MAG: hypothetical protein ACK4NC_03515 [Candidatus Gracilibacteria bacterium]